MRLASEPTAEVISAAKSDFSHTVEHKRISREKAPTNVITKIGPLEWGPGRGMYYPVQDEKNMALYQRHVELTDARRKEIEEGIFNPEAEDSKPEQSGPPVVTADDGLFGKSKARMRKNFGRVKDV
jgi:UDP-galactopyranose mutase